METREDFGNARGIRNLCDEAVVRQKTRITRKGVRQCTDEEFVTITEEDLKD